MRHAGPSLWSASTIQATQHQLTVVRKEGRVSVRGGVRRAAPLEQVGDDLRCRTRSRIYFKSPYRVMMNGISCETFKRRVIYVAGEGYWLSECVTMPSHVMSMLDDFVRHFSLGGKHRAW